jgi:hypothetical protein
MKYKYIIIIFLLSVIVYLSQDSLYRSGIVNQILLATILSINIIYWVKVLLFNGKDCLITTISIFLFITIISFFIYDGGRQSIFKTILLCISSIFPFYYIGRKGINIQRPLNLFFLLFLLLSCFSFHYYKNRAFEEKDIVYFVNNVGYNFVLLLPLLLLINKKILINIGLILIIIVYSILSAKRGVLVCLIFALIIYSVYQYKQLKITKIKMRKSTVIIMSFMLVGFLFIAMKNNDFFMSRWEDVSHNTSNRDVLLKTLNNYWHENLGIISLMFGFGLNATNLVAGNFAHNEFVEVIFNYGLIAFIFYISFLYIVFNRAKSENIHYPLKYALLSALVIWLSKGLTTGVITGETSLLLAIVIGYSSGLQNYYIRKEKYHENTLLNR